MSDESNILTIGALFAGRYEVRETLAEAPAWKRYRALDGDVDLEVELWRFRRELWPGAEARQRLSHSITAMRRFDHPHLVRLFNTGEIGACVYVTTQLCHAITPPAESGALLAYATAVAGALDAAHAAGKVHGRLTPADIVEVEGVLEVRGVGLLGELDWTVARPFFRDWGRYLAPEIKSGDRGTRAADVYSLAAILVTAAVGSETTDLQSAVERLRTRDRALHEALMPGLAVGPHERPGSLTAMVEAARSALPAPGAAPAAARRASALHDNQDEATVMARGAPPPPSSSGRAATAVRTTGPAPVVAPASAPASAAGMTAPAPATSAASASAPAVSATVTPARPASEAPVDDLPTESFFKLDPAELSAESDEATMRVSLDDGLPGAPGAPAAASASSPSSPASPARRSPAISSRGGQATGASPSARDASGKDGPARATDESKDGLETAKIPAKKASPTGKTRTRRRSGAPPPASSEGAGSSGGAARPGWAEMRDPPLNDTVVDRRGHPAGLKPPPVWANIPSLTGIEPIGPEADAPIHQPAAAPAPRVKSRPSKERAPAAARAPEPPPSPQRRRPTPPPPPEHVLQGRPPDSAAGEIVLSRSRPAAPAARPAAPSYGAEDFDTLIRKPDPSAPADSHAPAEAPPIPPPRPRTMPPMPPGALPGVSPGRPGATAAPAPSAPLPPRPPNIRPPGAIPQAHYPAPSELPGQATRSEPPAPSLPIGPPGGAFAGEPAGPSAGPSPGQPMASPASPPVALPMTQPMAPAMAPMDRPVLSPEAQQPAPGPVLRSMPPADLGHYAPPSPQRASRRRSRRARRSGLLAVVLVIAALVGVGIAVVLAKALG